MNACLKLLALMMIFIVADIPFVIAAFDEQGNYYVGEGEDEAFNDYYDGLQQEAPEEQSVVRESPQACADKHSESSSAASLLDNSLIGKFEKVIEMLHGICTALNAINSVLSTLDSVMGGRPPASGWCCFAGLSYIPFLGYALSAICNFYHSFYTGWENFFRPIGGNFCCLINCNYCNGANCFEKAKSLSEKKADDAAYKRGMAGVAERRSSIFDSSLDKEQAKKYNAEAAALEKEAKEDKEKEDDKNKGFTRSISDISETVFGPDSWLTTGAYVVSGQWLVSNKLYNTNGASGPVPAGLRAMRAGASEGSSTKSFVDILGASIDPYGDIYTATACFCLPGVLYNLKKLKVIYDTHACCVQKACEKGISTEGCDRMLSEMKCMYWEGSLWSALAKVVIALAVTVVKKVIMDYLGQLIPAALSCAIAIWDLAHTKDMVSSLSSLSSITDGLDVKCEELDFGGVSDEKGLLKSSEARSRGFGSEIANLSSFSPDDRDGDGIIDSVEFYSSSQKRAQGEIYFNSKGVLVSYDGSNEAPVDKTDFSKGLTTVIYNGKSYDLSGATKTGGTDAGTTAQYSKYTKDGATYFLSQNYFGVKTGAQGKEVYSQYSSEGALVLDKSKNEYSLTTSDGKKAVFTRDNHGTNEQSRLLLTALNGGATADELNGATFTSEKQAMNVQVNNKVYIFSEGIFKFGGQEFPASLYSRIKAERDPKYSEFKFESSDKAIVINLKDDSNYFIIKDGASTYAITSDGRTKIELSESWYSYLIGDKQISASDLSSVVSFIGKDVNTQQAESKTVLSNGVGENEYGSKKVEIENGKVTMTSVSSPEGWGRKFLFGTADYVKTIRTKESNGEITIGEFVFESKSGLESNAGRYLSTTATINNNQLTSVKVDRKIRSIEKLFVSDSTTNYATSGGTSYTIDGKSYTITPADNRPDLLKITNNNNKEFYLSVSPSAGAFAVGIYKFENGVYKSVSYDESVISATEAKQLVADYAVAAGAYERFARSEGSVVVGAEQRRYVLYISALTEQVVNEVAYRLASFLVQKTIGRAVEKKIQERCEENWDASEPVQDAPENTHSSGAVRPELSNCRGELATIASAELLHKFKVLDNSFIYNYSFSVTNCNADVDYEVYLKGASGVQSVASGSALLGSIVSRSSAFSSPVDYSEICVETTATNGLCVPFKGVLEFQAVSPAPAPEPAPEPACEFSFSSEVVKDGDDYLWSYSLNLCAPENYFYGFANGNQFEQASVVSKFAPKGPVVEHGSFSSETPLSQFCIERRGVLSCSQFAEYTAPEFVPPEGVTFFRAVAVREGASYSIDAAVYPNNGAVDYTLFLRDGAEKLVVDSGIAREEKNIKVSAPSSEVFAEICLSTFSDASFGVNGVLCYPVN